MLSLGALHPSLLDGGASHVKSGGHGWTLRHAVEIHLDHGLDPPAAY